MITLARILYAQKWKEAEWMIKAMELRGFWGDFIILIFKLLFYLFMFCKLPIAA